MKHVQYGKKSLYVRWVWALLHFSLLYTYAKRNSALCSVNGRATKVKCYFLEK